jgi:hypothetical protein
MVTSGSYLSFHFCFCLWYFFKFTYTKYEFNTIAGGYIFFS